MHRYDRYDYESAYNADISKMSEDAIERMMKAGKVKCVYRTKTVRHGLRTTCDIYPGFAKRSDLPHSPIRKESSSSQKKLNTRKSLEKMEQVINCNFSADDIWITLEYDQKHLPKDIEDALKKMQNYIRKVNRHLKKAGYEPLRYVYVTEYDDPETGKKKRVHHHMICTCDLGRDRMEELWTNGSRTKSEYLDPREEGWLKGLANYMGKGNYSRKTGQRRWNSSKGLKRPVISKSYSRFSRASVDKMVMDDDTARRLAEKSYHGYQVIEINKFWNESNRSFYLRIELIRKDWQQQIDIDRQKRPGAVQRKGGKRGSSQGNDSSGRSRPGKADNVRASGADKRVPHTAGVNDTATR